MKIQGPTPAERPLAAQRAVIETRSEKSVKVSVDGSGGRNDAVRRAEQTDGEARTDRVKSLATAVKNGTYHPDPSQIAARMLETAGFLEDLEAALDEGP